VRDEFERRVDNFTSLRESSKKRNTTHQPKYHSALQYYIINLVAPKKINVLLYVEQISLD